MHRQKRQIEAEEDDSEGPFAERFVEEAPGHLRKPNVQSAEHGEEVDADQHVVDMSHHEIGVGDLQIGRHGGGDHARHAADDEHHDEAGEVEKGGGHDRTAGPDRRDPREYANRARNGDREGRAAEESERKKWNAGREHVVQPDAKAQRHGRNRSDHHRGIADERPAAEEGQGESETSPIAGSTTT